MKSFTFNYWFVFIILVFFKNIGFADEWEGWRGLEKQGRVQMQDVPLTWDQEQNVLWKAGLVGEGHSSPVVSTDFVFITSAALNTGTLRFTEFLAHGIFAISIILLILIGFLRFRLLLNKQNPHSLNPASTYLSFFLDGLFFFSFFIMHYLFFHEARFDFDRVFVTWLFSGALVLLILLNLLRLIHLRPLMQFFFALIYLFLIVLLIKYRPFPNYYSVSRILEGTQVSIFGLIIQSVYLPGITVLFLGILTSIRRRIKSNSSVPKKEFSTPEIRIRQFLAVFSFLIGASGALSALIIVGLKVFYRKFVNGAPVQVDISTIFDYTFPYFLAFLSLGFLVIIFVELKGNKMENRLITKLYAGIVMVSILFFLLINFGIKKPEYLRLVSCYNRKTGVQLWQKKLFKGPSVCNSTLNSQATPTPIIHNDKIYAYFGSAGLACFDFSGNLKWTNADLPYEDLYGVGASPLITDSSVIVSSAMPKSPYVSAIDLRTGIQRWRTELPGWSSMQGEYRTPLVTRIDGQEILIEWNSPKNEIRFYNTTTGKIIKRYHPKIAHRGENVPSPSISGDTLFLTDRAKIEAISLSKIMNNQSPEIWTTQLHHHGPDTPSPVIGNNRIYVISDNGNLFCIDIKNGKILWQDRLKGVYYSSPISINNKYIFLSDIKGTTTVIADSTKFYKVSENHLSEGIISSIAGVDNQFFIRTEKNLWCIGHP